jgi:hypothetical protein
MVRVRVRMEDDGVGICGVVMRDHVMVVMGVSAG